MKLHYDPDTDSLYIELTGAPGAQTREIVEDLWPTSMRTATSSASTSIMRQGNSIFPRSRRLHCRRHMRRSESAVALMKRSEIRGFFSRPRPRIALRSIRLRLLRAL